MSDLLEKELSGILSSISTLGVESQDNWAAYESAYLKLSQIFSSANPPSLLSSPIFDLYFKQILEFIIVSSKSPRSAILSALCLALKTLSKVRPGGCGGDAYLLPLSAALLKLVSQSKKVISQLGVDTLLVLLQHSTIAGGNNYKAVLALFCEPLLHGVKNTGLREACSQFVLLIFKLHHHAFPSLSPSLISQTLQKSLGDASSTVRQHSRSLFVILKEFYPEEAERLFNSLDNSVKKQILGSTSGASDVKIKESSKVAPFSFCNGNGNTLDNGVAIFAAPPPKSQNSFKPTSTAQTTPKSAQTPVTKAQSPTISKQTPTTSKQIPTSSKQIPSSSKHTPTASKQTPSSSKHTPLAKSYIPNPDVSIVMDHHYQTGDGDVSFLNLVEFDGELGHETSFKIKSGEHSFLDDTATGNMTTAGKGGLVGSFASAAAAAACSDGNSRLSSIATTNTADIPKTPSSSSSFQEKVDRLLICLENGGGKLSEKLFRNLCRYSTSFQNSNNADMDVWQRAYPALLGCLMQIISSSNGGKQHKEMALLSLKCGLESHFELFRGSEEAVLLLVIEILSCSQEINHLEPDIQMCGGIARQIASLLLRNVDRRLLAQILLSKLRSCLTCGAADSGSAATQICFKLLSELCTTRYSTSISERTSASSATATTPFHPLEKDILIPLFREHHILKGIKHASVGVRMCTFEFLVSVAGRAVMGQGFVDTYLVPVDFNAGKRQKSKNGKSEQGQEDEGGFLMGLPVPSYKLFMTLYELSKQQQQQS